MAFVTADVSFRTLLVSICSFAPAEFSPGQFECKELISVRIKQRSRNGLVALFATATSAAVLLSLLGATAPAHAATNQFVVTTTLDGRTAKDLDNHAYPNKYPNGTTITVVCQDTGPVTYGGSNIWDYTSDHLWVVDYYVRTGYSGFSPDVPRCDANNSPSAGNVVGTKFPVTATLDGRTAKDLNNHAYPNRYAAGSTITIVCQDSGPDAYGSTVWDYTAEGLWVTDVYVKTGYSGFDPDLQRCFDAGAPRTYGGDRFLVTATLDGRTAKDLNNHAYPDRYVAGSMVTIACQDYGPEAYGSTIWDYTADRLWVVDRYIKTGFSGFAPGLPRCNGSTSPPVPSGSSGDRDRIVRAMQSQVGTYPEHNRDNCEPYATNFQTPYLCGDNQPWCAYFASWVWRQAGVWGANYGGSNQFYYWGKARGLLRDFSHIKPGDAVLYGSGPGASVHIGLVETVLADGRIGTIEGNWGDGVVRKAPFDPRNTGWQPIYAVVSPFDDSDGSGVQHGDDGGNMFMASATLDGRTAKDLNNHAYPDKYPAGSWITVTCQDTGPSAYGSTIWDYTSDRLWVPDYYVKTGYSGFDPDIPLCTDNTPTLKKNPAYTEAMNLFFGTRLDLARAALPTGGGGSDSDLVIARAFIQGGDAVSDWFVDHGGFSSKVNAPARAMIAWEPKSGNVGLIVKPTCPNGTACKPALDIKNVGTTIPLGTECDGPVHPLCYAHYDYNKVGASGSGGAVFVRFQLADSYASVPGAGFAIPGAIDGYLNIVKDSAGFHVTLNADEYPSWEIIRVPKHNSSGNYETHLIGTRAEKTLKYLCTSCWGQASTTWVG
jgi:CHAP domain